MVKKRFDGWFIISIIMLLLFIAVLIYPMVGIIKQSVIMPDGSVSWSQFQKFFGQSYYSKTIVNSFKITFFVTALTLVIGIPFAYFYAFYRLKGAKILFVVSILCCMSAPFLGAYSWVMLLGRAGIITKFFKSAFGIKLPSIYGFGGIALSQTLKFFPLVFIYMNGAFKSIDNTLMEAASNMGCVGVKRLFKIVLNLTMPTILAAALMVFMQAFADFGTPTVLGEGFKTFPVLLYNEYLGENGSNYNFAAALAVIAVIVTAVVFFLQKWATSRFKFSINALHPVEKKPATGFGGFLMHLYCYLLCAIAFLPQIYIIYLSFRKCKGADKVSLVTDSLYAAGLAVKSIRLGGESDGREGIVEDGVVKLPDRSAFALFINEEIGFSLLAGLSYREDVSEDMGILFPICKSLIYFAQVPRVPPARARALHERSFSAGGAG